MRVGRSEACAVRETSMICLVFFPTQKINGFFSQIQESRISEDDARERGLGLFE